MKSSSLVRLKRKFMILEKGSKVTGLHKGGELGAGSSLSEKSAARSSGRGRALRGKFMCELETKRGKKSDLHYWRVVLYSERKLNSEDNSGGGKEG